MTPRRDKPIEIIDGWSMRLKSTRSDGIKLFYCTELNRRAQCRGAVHLNPATNTFTVIREHERHDKDFIQSSAYMMRQQLKKEANRGKPREVIDIVRSQYSTPVSLAVGGYNAKRKMMHRALENLSPETIAMNEGGGIAPEYQNTLSGEPFLLADVVDGLNRVVIFASARCLELLSRATIIMADGTFDVAPRGFAQLFTIHGYVSPSVVRPLVYCLLTDKKTETYQKVIQLLKSRTILTNWRPELICCDFEQALKNSFVFEFPNVLVEGCLFHLIQSWRREAKRLKLYDDFSTGIIWDFWCRLKSIPFLPATDSQDFYNELITSIPPIHPAAFQDYLSYLERNYMAATSRYPPTMWSCHVRTLNGVHRTTNALEVWHRTISTVVAEKNGFSMMRISDLMNKICLEERHTFLDSEELRLNPNHTVNKSRTPTNLLKDVRLLKVLENNPPPPNTPLLGIDLLDAISLASRV